jgi:hypothetical protein
MRRLELQLHPPNPHGYGDGSSLMQHRIGCRFAVSIVCRSR